MHACLVVINLSYCSPGQLVLVLHMYNHSNFGKAAVEDHSMCQCVLCK